VHLRFPGRALAYKFEYREEREREELPRDENRLLSRFRSHFYDLVSVTRTYFVEMKKIEMVWYGMGWRDWREWRN